MISEAFRARSGRIGRAMSQLQFAARSLCPPRFARSLPLPSNPARRPSLHFCQPQRPSDHNHLLQLPNLLSNPHFILSIAKSSHLYPFSSTLLLALPFSVSPPCNPPSPPFGRAQRIISPLPAADVSRPLVPHAAHFLPTNRLQFRVQCRWKPATPAERGDSIPHAALAVRANASSA